MNAYYSYTAFCYEKTMKETYGLREVSGKLKILGRDAESMGAVAWQLDPHFPSINDKTRLTELWQGNYVIENELRSYSAENARDLYDSAVAALTEENINPRYEALNRRAAEFDMALFPFLLIEYPYNWRCKYLHGNRTTALFMAYNDYEMGVLTTINYFLERFLDTAIPEMFSDSFWSEEKQTKVMEFMHHIRQSNGKDEFQKALDKAVKK